MKTRPTTLLCALLGTLPTMSFGQQPATAPSAPSEVRSLNLTPPNRQNKRVYMEVAEVQFKLAQHAVEDDLMMVAKLRSSIRERTGLPSSAGLQPLVLELQLLRETLQQEEAAAAGRRAGLEAAIAEWTDRAKARMADDPAIKELELVVQKQEHVVERMKQLLKTASISQGEFDDGVANLAIDKAKVVTARQRTANTSNEASDGWNRELMNLNIAAHERDARSKYIETRLKMLEPAMDHLDQLENATANLHAAEQDLRVARQRYEEAQRLYQDPSAK